MQIQRTEYDEKAVRTCPWLDEEVKIALLSGQGRPYEVLKGGELHHFIIINGKSPRKSA